MSRLLRSGKGLTLGEVQAHREALRAGTANTSGLPALPTELLFEIISHFPTVPLPIGSHDRRTVYPAHYLERHRILRVLSQMCCSLRRIFLPYVWEKIEVWASSRVPHGAPGTAARRSHRKLVNKELATELVSQLEIVTIRDSTLAQRVKIVTVLVTNFSTETVAAELARCLALFHNLRTLQVFGDSRRAGECVADALKGKLFPSVHLVSMNISPSVLSSFPEVRDVSIMCANAYSASTFLTTAWPENCHAIEVLRGFEDVDYRDNLVLEAMIHMFPKTRTVVLDANNLTLTPDVMKLFSRFPDLTCIEFRLHAKDKTYLSQRSKGLVDMAEEILRSKPGVDGLSKWVVLDCSCTRHRICVT